MLSSQAFMLTCGDKMTYEPTPELYVNRNKSVAKSFYRQLKTEGFTHQQIIELSTTLLDLVTEDLRDEVVPND